MLYYADRISDNIRKREPEGYLICVNVPIARMGTQRYMQDELGQRGEDEITVYRPEEEVFSKATIASFEGMPVTNDHPDDPEGVTADNIQWLQKGHCQNVRRGSGNEKDLLIADLLITDPHTIQQVLDGKREISCGYNYELCEEDGKYVQRQIRGNHIAIVDKGRAGHRVCIKDSAPTHERRKKMAKNHNSIWGKMLAAFARDAEPEEIEEAVNAIDDAMNDPEDTEVPAPVPEETKDADPMADILARLEKLEAALAAKDADEPEEEDPLKKLEDDLNEIEKAQEEPIAPDEDPTEPESHFVDPEQINEQDADIGEIESLEEEEAPALDKRACDALRAGIKALKPVINQLPPGERKKAADAAVASLRKSAGLASKPVRNDYLALKPRKKAADAAVDEGELGRRIMSSRNVNMKNK